MAAVDCELVVSVAVVTEAEVEEGVVTDACKPVVVVTEAEVGEEVIANSCEPLPAVTPVEEVVDSVVVVVVMTTIETVVSVCRLQVCKEHFELVVWVHF